MNSLYLGQKGLSIEVDNCHGAMPPDFEHVYAAWARVVAAGRMAFS